MNDFAVSPRFRRSDLAGGGRGLDLKIDVFEDQVEGWLLGQAHMLATSTTPQAQHAGFAILTLMLTYVEGIACSIKGETSDGKSPEFFKFGLQSIFPEMSSRNVDAFCKEFYRQIRCGLLHQALTRGKASITHSGAAAISATLAENGSVVHIQVDPWVFLTHASEHFKRYVAQLRDPGESDLRQKFERWFDERAA